jgi:hypothetical protein
LLDAPSPAHRIYNVVDDEAPDLATLFASVGAPPPDGSDAERARAFDTHLDGRRIREDLGFKPKFPRLADDRRRRIDDGFLAGTSWRSPGPHRARSASRSHRRRTGHIDLTVDGATLPLGGEAEARVKAACSGR